MARLGVAGICPPRGMPPKPAGYLRSCGLRGRRARKSVLRSSSVIATCPRTSTMPMPRSNDIVFRSLSSRPGAIWPRGRESTAESFVITSADAPTSTVSKSPNGLTMPPSTRMLCRSLSACRSCARLRVGGPSGTPSADRAAGARAGLNWLSAVVDDGSSAEVGEEAAAAELASPSKCPASCSLVLGSFAPGEILCTHTSSSIAAVT